MWTEWNKEGGMNMSIVVCSLGMTLSGTSYIAVTLELINGDWNNPELLMVFGLRER